MKLAVSVVTPVHTARGFLRAQEWHREALIESEAASHTFMVETGFDVAVPLKIDILDRKTDSDLLTVLGGGPDYGRDKALRFP